MSRPSKVYLAARYSRHDEMQGVRDVLGAAFRIEVTSRWIDCHSDVTGDFTKSFTPEFLASNPQDCAPLGQHDLDDLIAADTCISFTSGDGGKGGRHVEFGVALALGKRLIVVGPREHIFHTLPQVEWFPNWSRLVMAWSELMDREHITLVDVDPQQVYEDMERDLREESL